MGGNFRGVCPITGRQQILSRKTDGLAFRCGVLSSEPLQHRDSAVRSALNPSQTVPSGTVGACADAPVILCERPHCAVLCAASLKCWGFTKLIPGVLSECVPNALCEHFIRAVLRCMERSFGFLSGVLRNARLSVQNFLCRI